MRLQNYCLQIICDQGPLLVFAVGLVIMTTRTEDDASEPYLRPPHPRGLRTTGFLLQN
jgi:hypothetical protein